MDDEEFQNYIDEAVASLPDEFRKMLENVEILVDDYPTAEQLVRSHAQNGMLLGLYEVIPKTRRGHYGVGPTLPDRITIFRYPIFAIARSKEHAIDLIKATVKHEIAHHFGMNEEAVRKAEAKRRG